mgnify:CR=1 FL=1
MKNVIPHVMVTVIPNAPIVVTLVVVDVMEFVEMNVVMIVTVHA